MCAPFSTERCCARGRARSGPAAFGGGPNLAGKSSVCAPGRVSPADALGPVQPGGKLDDVPALARANSVGQRDAGLLYLGLLPMEALGATASGAGLYDSVVVPSLGYAVSSKRRAGGRTDGAVGMATAAVALGAGPVGLPFGIAGRGVGFDRAAALPQ